MSLQNDPIAILPWYEPCDFAEIMVIGGHDGDPAEIYDRWYRGVMQATDDLLHIGYPIAFITIRPAAYKSWLGERPNTLGMRLLYAEYLATISDTTAA